MPCRSCSISIPEAACLALPETRLPVVTPLPWTEPGGGLSLFEFVFTGLAAMAAGLVNAIAGGGTLITFPALVAAGLPAVAANVTSTVALSPGYLAAAFAQCRDLRGQKSRLMILLPAGVVGGVIGGLLLLGGGERIFSSLVPYLILLASLLLALQDQVRGLILRRAAREGSSAPSEKWLAIPIGLAAIYGGYFGAGLSVIVLATLGLLLGDPLPRLNALKQAVSFSVNIAAALFFVFSGKVLWSAAIVMAIAAMIGGALGGRLSGRMNPATLRKIVVTVGFAVGLVYLLR